MKQNIFQIPEKTIVFNDQFYEDLLKRYKIRFNGNKEDIDSFTTPENITESFGKENFFLLSDLKEYGMNSMTVPELMMVPLIPKLKHLSKNEMWRVVEYVLTERKDETRSDGHFLTHIGFVKISPKSDSLASVLILNHSDVGETIIWLATDLAYPKIGWVARVCGVEEK